MKFPLTPLATPSLRDMPALPHNHKVTPRELANSICDTLVRHGHQALFVGGCVRDLLLGREPADYDICTDATPDRVISLFPESPLFAPTSAPPTGAIPSVWFSHPDLKRTCNGATSRSTVS
jgi:hypothetical protein